MSIRKTGEGVDDDHIIQIALDNDQCADLRNPDKRRTPGAMSPMGIMSPMSPMSPMGINTQNNESDERKTAERSEAEKSREAASLD